MIYYKLNGVSVITDAKFVSSHHNSKGLSKVLFERYSAERREHTKINVALLNNPTEQYNRLTDNFDENSARNVKQVSNMQHAYHNLANMLDHQLCIANIRLDVVRYIIQHPT